MKYVFERTSVWYWSVDTEKEILPAPCSCELCADKVTLSDRKSYYWDIDIPDDELVSWIKHHCAKEPYFSIVIEYDKGIPTLEIYDDYRE